MTIGSVIILNSVVIGALGEKPMKLEQETFTSFHDMYSRTLQVAWACHYFQALKFATLLEQRILHTYYPPRFESVWELSAIRSCYPKSICFFQLFNSNWNWMCLEFRKLQLKKVPGFHSAVRTNLPWGVQADWNVQHIGAQEQLDFHRLPLDIFLLEGLIRTLFYFVNLMVFSVGSLWWIHGWPTLLIDILLKGSHDRPWLILEVAPD